MAVQVPIIVGDVFRVQDAVLILGGIFFREIIADEVGVDGAVHHHVGHVNIQRPQLTGHALGQCPYAMFGARECGEPRSAAQSRRPCPGKQNRPALALDHALGHFPCIEKA